MRSIGGLMSAPNDCMSTIEPGPSAGDIYLANLNSIRGSEQSGVRPVIVISEQTMNCRLKRVIVCPVTSNMQPWMTKVALPDHLETRGMVLVDQVRSIDKAERLLRFIEPTSPAFLGEVRSYLGRLLGLELPDSAG